MTVIAGFGLVCLSKMVSCACLCFRWSMRACAADNVGGETLNFGETTASSGPSPDRRRLRGLSGFKNSVEQGFPIDDPDGVMFRAFGGVNADASEGMSVAADSAIYDDDDSLRDW